MVAWAVLAECRMVELMGGLVWDMGNDCSSHEAWTGELSRLQRSRRRLLCLNNLTLASPVPSRLAEVSRTMCESDCEHWVHE